MYNVDQISKGFPIGKLDLFFDIMVFNYVSKCDLILEGVFPIFSHPQEMYHILKIAKGQNPSKKILMIDNSFLNWNTYIEFSIIHKYIGDEDPYYNTKILIFSFTWAGVAVFHKASTI